jgi:hypothetical protein
MAALAIVVSLLLMTGTPGFAETSEQASANAEKKKRERDSARRKGAAAKRSYRGESDYHEMDADKLPIGSSRWFEQMEREGRFPRRP